MLTDQEDGPLDASNLKIVLDGLHKKFFIGPG